MKNKILFIMTFTLSILLAGCTFSFGDGEQIEVSTDGITKSDAVEKEVASEETDEVEEQDEGEGKAEEQDEGKSEEGKEESDLSQILAGGQDCENDYGDLTEVMPENFSMPDCAEIDYVNFSRLDYMNRSSYEGRYNVEESWKDIYAMYVEYLESNDFQIAEQQKSKMEGKLKAEKGLSTLSITASEDDEGVTTLRVIHDLSDEVEGE